MAIKVTSGFDVRGKTPIDARILMTKAQMLAANDKVMPENYICICNDADEDRGKLFIFSKSFVAHEEYGKFKPYEEILNMAQAITDALQDPTKRTEFLSAMTDMFNDEHFDIIDQKIDLAISVIQAIGPEV